MQIWYFIQRLNYLFWNGLRWLVGLGVKPAKIPAWVYQTIHFLFIALITILLGIFSQQLMGETTTITGSSPIIRKIVNPYFLGVLFLLGYISIRLIIFVIKLFMMREESEFPDIDAAWGAGLEGLAKGGLDLHSLPVFLITGMIASSFLLQFQSRVTNKCPSSMNF